MLVWVSLPRFDVARRIDVSIRGLTPGYFALVMATGIVSVGMRSNGWHLVSATSVLGSRLSQSGFHVVS